MQERYLGDSHDFAKYALLWHLHATLKRRLGLHWYLTDPVEVDKPGNNDGEKRHHFSSAPWRGWQPELLAKLAPLQPVSERRLSRVEDLEILPPATLTFDRPVAREGRLLWHRQALEAFEAAEIIFLDPDNGFEVPSATRRTRPKYALYTEALDYVAQEKAVICSQFARQCDPFQRATSVRRHLSSLLGREISTPVVRARFSPTLLFVSVAPEAMEADLAAALRSFAADRDKIELIA